MLKVNHLSAGYPGKAVLHDVSFTLPKGSVTVLLGPNGSGKTTLLKALCCILHADTGEVLWEETVYFADHSEELQPKTSGLERLLTRFFRRREH